MEVNETVFDLEFLIELSNQIYNYMESISNASNDSSNGLRNLNYDWNDEDYLDILKFIDSFSENVKNMKEVNFQILDRISEKIEAINELHKLKIGK